MISLMRKTCSYINDKVTQKYYGNTIILTNLVLASRACVPLTLNIDDAIHNDAHYYACKVEID